MKVKKEEQETIDAALEFARIPTFCAFSTINGRGFPETCMMINIKSDNSFVHKLKYFKLTDFNTYLCTHLSTDKVGHIRANPKSNVYYTKGYDGLLVIGNSHIVEDKEIRHHFWESNFQWDSYYTGKDDPEYTLIKFTAEEIKFYYELKSYKIPV